ncbi:hypothetical protein BV22DRAFT_1028217 [Leucogyrophana mollusca]|uniref:Uncharacterized protein n=1 Tax=Leucogyrophana mollusca TaxID=85980 RepID=A0ACB8BX59_9AGAM|nr:hypothetical protein BV22DRAFT_1028217 [Leucogyrophana mollusca]
MSRPDSPPQPPVPFADFEYAFDPVLSGLFPPPLPLPSSADLFSPSETTDLLGFLDNFNWEFEGDPSLNDTQNPPHIPYPSDTLDTLPDAQPPSNAGQATHPTPSEVSSGDTIEQPTPDSEDAGRQPNPPVPPTKSGAQNSKRKGAAAPRQTTRVKPLLSSPQKRLNHIMSEQKRRNAIRDGYAQLISLLAPDGAHALDMPTRGRPKGSGSGGKGQSKGKSGVLFRAVEYCRWLEEGRDALREEVLRVEAAVGL